MHWDANACVPPVAPFVVESSFSTEPQAIPLSRWHGVVNGKTVPGDVYVTGYRHIRNSPRAPHNDFIRHHTPEAGLSTFRDNAEKLQNGKQILDVGGYLLHDRCFIVDIGIGADDGPVAECPQLESIRRVNKRARAE